MAIDNRSNLNNAIESWCKRNFATGDLDTFTSLATARIGIDLRSQANQGFVTLSPMVAPNTNIYVLPDDYNEVRFVEQVNGSFIQQIKPMGIGQAHSFETLNSTALGYLVYSALEVIPDQTGTMWLQLVPGNGEDISVDYWQIPQDLGRSGLSGALTNPTLVRYPQLYLYASLISAWDFVQNWDQRNALTQLYEAELTRINSASNTARYGAGAARASGARFYNNAPSRAM